MSIYRRVLALLYFFGFLLHLSDVFDFRLSFSKMDPLWKAWILFLLLADLFAAMGLWAQKEYGDILFVIIATSQLIAYVGFKNIFGDQSELILFHVITLIIYFAIRGFTALTSETRG